VCRNGKGKGIRSGVERSGWWWRLSMKRMFSAKRCEKGFGFRDKGASTDLN
jgi:hypothetical protein